ncbi:contractile injection system tape measure protein [Puia sp. P3]
MIEKHAVDILVRTYPFPWNMSIIKLPWLQQAIHLDW